MSFATGLCASACVKILGCSPRGLSGRGGFQRVLNWRLSRSPDRLWPSLCLRLAGPDDPARRGDRMRMCDMVAWLDMRVTIRLKLGNSRPWFLVGLANRCGERSIGGAVRGTGLKNKEGSIQERREGKPCNTSTFVPQPAIPRYWSPFPEASSP